jgi:hypothetical protein
MRKVTMGLAVFLLLGLGWATEATAQVNATVTGTVGDPTGALIPAVEVTATNVNTGIVQMRITNETGSYNFAALQAGTYTVSAALPGFQTKTIQNVTLSQGQQIRLNFTLEVAAVGQTVEVTVDTDVALATTSASIGDVLPQIEVSSLPLAERDVFDLLETVGGAVGTDGRWSFGGQRSNAVNVTRDGMVVNDTRYLTSAGALTATYSSPDLVEEVQLVVGAVDAEAGRGSGQVALQTRSGTNGFHGALFYGTNNSVLNANTFFNNLRGQPKDYLNRTQFGGRLAGPIIRNKLFFFVLTDNQRYVRKENFVATVLTQQARQGTFRYMNGVPNANALQANPSVDLQGNVLNPANLRSFNLYNVPGETNRKSPSSHPYLQRVLSAMPLPNDYTVGDGLNTAGYSWSRRITGEASGLRVGNNTHRNQLNYRLDYQLNQANRVSFINSREESFSDQDNPLWPTAVGGKTINKPGIWTASWTSTISPALLNDLRVGWKKTSSHNRSPFELGCCFGKAYDDRDPKADELFKSLPTYNGIQLQPEASIWGDGIAGHGFGSTRGQDSPTYQIVESMSWTRGAHSFKGGFEYIWQWSDGWNTTSEQFPEALLGNGGAPVIGINSANFPGLQAADATLAERVLNDLAGSIATIEQGFVLSSARQKDWTSYGRDDFRRFREFHQNDYAFYFKDTWKVTNNLTLNLGVRYDMYGAMWEQNGLAASTNRGTAGIFSISGSGFENWWYPNRRTDGGLTETLLVGKNSPNPDKLFWPNDRNNWAPSVGFSYALPDARTVIRGGAGVNYAGANEILDYELSFGNVPGSTDIRRFSPGSYIDFSNVGTIFPLSPATAPFAPATLTERTGDFDVNADDRKTPYIYNWQLSLQRELARNLTLDAAYIGNKATRLFQVIELNEPDIFAAWQGQTFLDAFNQTRAGGNAPLFDTMLRGINLGAGTCGVVNGATCTGSSALRGFGATDNLIADGEVAELARFINSSRNGTGVAGGLLRRNGLPENFIMVSPQFSDAQIWGTGDNSTYHSMQIQLRKRLSQGFSGQLSYTWSKALGNAGGTGSAVGGLDNEATPVLDPRNRRLSKARLGWDRSHQWNAHGLWELPFGPGRTLLADAPSWVARLVEGWQISSIFSYEAGAPLSIAAQSRTVSANPGTFQTTPNLVGNLPKDFGKVTVTDRGVQYFQGLSRARDTANFGRDPENLAADFGLWNIVDSSGNVILTNPEPGKVGTLGIRHLSGPARLGLDLALQKRVRLSEGMTFTVRADAIDVLNTPQWGTPNLDMGSAGFGQITSASGNRRFTLNARIDF